MELEGTVLFDEAMIETIAARLLPKPPQFDAHGSLVPDWAPSQPFERPPVFAAVLIGLVARPAGHTVLYTQRASSLRVHSGQVAFPGGKLDPEDRDAGDAALREASEEVGLLRDDARILGYLPTYYTGSNYLISPVVAEISPSKAFAPNPGEVEAVFEVPLARIFDISSYGTFRITRDGREHRTWQIDHEGHKIWGITANLTRQFSDLTRGSGPL